MLCSTGTCDSCLMNYTEVINLALSTADRTDASVTTRMVDFIRLVEARINKKIKTLKMSARANLATVEDQAYYGLPPDFEGVRDIQLNDENGDHLKTLSYLSPVAMNELNAFDLSPQLRGKVYYTIIADQLQIKPAQKENFIEIIYYQRVPPLTAVDLTNWISDINPDCYVFGLVTEISAFVKDGDAFTFWENRFLNTLDDIHKNDSDVRWSGTPLQVRAL